MIYEIVNKVKPKPMAFKNALKQATTSNAIVFQIFNCTNCCCSVKEVPLHPPINYLTLKALGFFLPVQHWGVFEPFCKIRSRHPREFKLTELTAYVMFYKICKFESSTITNDVIMTSLRKTMATFGPPRNQTNYISFERY